MSKNKFVSYRGDGFWAYDVAHDILLKHLIDVAKPRADLPGNAWLADAMHQWGIECIQDLGLMVEETWPAAQFTELLEVACRVLKQRDGIPAEEVESWVVLEDIWLCVRGEKVVLTQPIIELGEAIIALVHGSLPPPPDGTSWSYGWPGGPITFPCAPI